jgi:NlpC/P60 family putative phage cell wall peptidase
MDWSEPQGDERLWAAAKRHLTPKNVSAAAAGDVLLFRMRSEGVAKHLGLQAQDGRTPSFIHAYSGHGVVESPLSAPWLRRVVARFEFPPEFPQEG